MKKDKHEVPQTETYRYKNTEVISSGNLARREQLLRYAIKIGWLLFAFTGRGLVGWISELF